MKRAPRCEVAAAAAACSAHRASQIGAAALETRLQVPWEGLADAGVVSGCDVVGPDVAVVAPPAAAPAVAGAGAEAAPAVVPAAAAPVAARTSPRPATFPAILSGASVDPACCS